MSARKGLTNFKEGTSPVLIASSTVPSPIRPREPMSGQKYNNRASRPGHTPTDGHEHWQSPRSAHANRTADLSEARTFDLGAPTDRSLDRSDDAAGLAPTDAERTMQSLALWISLVRDAEPLPDPRRGLFRWRGHLVRMPRRKADGRVVLKTEDGAVRRADGSLISAPSPAHSPPSLPPSSSSSASSYSWAAVVKRWQLCGCHRRLLSKILLSYYFYELHSS